MPKRLFGFALIWLLAFSCGSPKETEDLGNISIDVASTISPSLSEKFNVQKVVVLDNSEKLLGRIGEIQQHNDKLYISTQSRGNGLFIFDLDGKYLGQFGRKGNGPGEYNYIQSYVIKEGLVYILDREAHRIDLYLLNGEFHKTLAKGVYGFNMALFGDELVVYTGNAYLDNDGKANKLLFYDLNGEFLRSEQDIDPNHAEFLNLIPQKVLSSKNQLYLEPFSDVIYQSTPQGLKGWRKLDFGKNTFEESELDRSYENVAQFVQYVRTQSYAIFLSNLRETDKWLSFDYEFKDPANPRLVMLDMNTEAVEVYDQIIEDVLTEGASLSFRQFKLVGSNTDQFIFAVSPYDLIDSGTALKTDQIETDGNPIVYLLNKAE